VTSARLPRAAHNRQAGAFLLFMLLLLPMGLLALSLAGEYSATLRTHRQAVVTAEAAAMAAATATRADDPTQLDPGEAQRRAQRTLDEAIDVGMMSEHRSTPTQLAAFNVDADLRVATVRLEFATPQLIITEVLTLGQASPELTGVVERQAEVCVPADETDAVGCRYP